MVAQPPRIPLTLGMEALVAVMLPVVGSVNLTTDPVERVTAPRARLTVAPLSVICTALLPKAKSVLANDCELVAPPMTLRVAPEAPPAVRPPPRVRALPAARMLLVGAPGAEKSRVSPPKRTFAPPVRVFAAVRTSVPAPVLVKPSVPATTVLRVAVSGSRPGAGGRAVTLATLMTADPVVTSRVSLLEAGLPELRIQLFEPTGVSLKIRVPTVLSPSRVTVVSAAMSRVKLATASMELGTAVFQLAGLFQEESPELFVQFAAWTGVTRPKRPTSAATAAFLKALISLSRIDVIRLLRRR
jgi:hypothetical protein